MNEYIFMLIGKSSLLMLIFLLINIFIYNNSAINRSFIYRLGFISVLLLPLFSIFMPRWDFLLFNLFPNLGASLSGGSVSTSIGTVSAASQTTVGLSWFNIAMLIWMAGTLVILVRILIGKIITSRLIIRAKPTTNVELTALITSVQNEFQLSKSLTVRISKQTTVPFVTGFIKQTIVLPPSFNSWSAEKQKMVLVHETAHIKRKDIFWLTLSLVTAALHWYNPLVWICRKKMIIDTEIACDNYVLSSGCKAQTYAEHLLNIAKNLSDNLFFSPINISMARKTQLEGRLMAILTKQTRSLKVTTTVSMIAIIITIAFLLPLSGMQLFAKENSEKTKTTIVTVKEKTPTMVTIADKKNEKEIEKLPGPDDFVVLTTYPEMIKMTNPVYPDKEKKKGIEGDVYVKALIKKDGTVHEALVAKTSGNIALDKSATEAALKNIFSPGFDKNEKPVACWIAYKVTFALADKVDSEK